MVRGGTLLPSLLLVLFLTACDQSANRVSTLWTDVPEMAAAVESFNASQREWQLLVEYREDPVPLLLAPGVKADLVVSRRLASSEVKNSMANLDFLFDGGNLAKSAFYQHGLDSGMVGERLRLVPLAFDLPVLAYSRSRQPDRPGFSITLDALKEAQTAFDEAPAAKGFRRQAFSPRWARFGTTFLFWAGASFREGFQSGLAWDGPTLTASLALYQNWPSPGWQQTEEFQNKYLQVDAGLALTTGRIQFFPSTLIEFLNRPRHEREDLDFRFLDQNGRVLAGETVWAGIPSSSMTRGAAERFLAWFFLRETQLKLIEEGRRQDDRAFGLLQGLSSLVDSNRGPLLETYPTLRGRLPAADGVVFWQTLPPDWPTLKTSVLQPWLETPTADEPGLKEALERHRAQAAQH